MRMADSAWDEYLRTFHRDKPRATDEGLVPFRSADGKTPYRLLADALQSRAGSRVEILDLACGDGRLVEDIVAVAGPAATVTGIDMSEHEIARARQRHPDATFCVGRAQSLPFDDDSFDVVLSHFAFMLMVPVVSVVAEISRVLRPGGSFVCAWSSLARVEGDLADILRLKRECERARPPEIPVFDPRQSTHEGIAELFAQTGDPRRVSLRTVPVTCTVDADGAWRFLDSLYFTERLEDGIRAELQKELGALTAARGGSLRLRQTIQIATLT
jgi:SAM-dependent methyltransferase